VGQVFTILFFPPILILPNDWIASRLLVSSVWLFSSHLILMMDCFSPIGFFCLIVSPRFRFFWLIASSLLILLFGCSSLLIRLFGCSSLLILLIGFFPLLILLCLISILPRWLLLFDCSSLYLALLSDCLSLFGFSLWLSLLILSSVWLLLSPYLVLLVWLFLSPYLVSSLSLSLSLYLSLSLSIWFYLDGFSLWLVNDDDSCRTLYDDNSIWLLLFIGSAFNWFGLFFWVNL